MCMRNTTRSAIYVHKRETNKTEKMTATVADLPPERFSELAGYLSGYPPDDPNSDEGSLLYWEMIAETLRRDLPSKFGSYTNIVSWLVLKLWYPTF